jgi:hypothetical protein
MLILLQAEEKCNLQITLIITPQTALVELISDAGSSFDGFDQF